MYSSVAESDIETIGWVEVALLGRGKSVELHWNSRESMPSDYVAEEVLAHGRW